ncbi:MAG: TIGR04066 family peptide maturation system protein [Clostridia bacterium]
MSKSIVYPLDRNTTPLLRYARSEFVAGVSPKGRGYGGGDLSVIDGGQKTSDHILEDFPLALEEHSDCDRIVFLQGAGVFNAQDYFSCLKIAQSNGKHIMLSKSIEKLLADEGHLISNVDIIESNEMPIEQCLEGYSSESLEVVPAPIVTVFGMGENTDKFFLQLAIREQFLAKGYNVLQLGSKEYSKLCGFQTLPDFVYNASIPMTKRIVALNHYLCQRINHEKPDVVIIGAPGGVMPLDRHFHNEFGELPFIISMAAQPDIAVLSMYYIPDMNLEFLNDIRTFLKYRLNCNFDFINIANTAYKIEDADSVPEIAFLLYDYNTVNETINGIVGDSKLCIFNAFTPNVSEQLCRIITELSNNVDIV